MRGAARCLLGVDIGGTFTDLVLLAPASGATWTTKILTTPRDPAVAVLEGLEAVLGQAGRAPKDLAAVVHATTLAGNALLERKGARTGVVTTRGFRDILETGREQRYDLYDVHLDLPAPLVPRALRRPVAERTAYDGRLLRPLAQDEARAAAAFLRERGVESVAVCFLHSYANPANEEAMARVLEASLPGAEVSLSSRVLPEIGEYGRFSTTTANAYIRPLVRRYLDRLGRELAARGHRGAFHVMTSRGARMTAEAAAEFPVRLLESGPAAGAHAAAALGRRLGARDLLSFDMGGTSAKICLIRDGRPDTTVEFEAARLARFKRKSGHLIRVPVVDLIEIGAGGGSLARVDALGLLAVGPESAGAEPGPACYGRGGTRPTVTDADLVLGFLDAAYFLGGRLRLDFAAARESIATHVGTPLGLDPLRAAWGIYTTVTDQMARAASVHAAEKGADLRRCTLLAFGGAGPVHAAHLARALGIRRVVVPPDAGVLSALGCDLAPAAFDLAASYKRALDEMDLERVTGLLRRMEKEGLALLRQAGARPGIRVEWLADMRHLGQRSEVTFRIPRRPLRPADLPAVERAFRDAYRARYGRSIPDVPVEAVTWRVVVSGPARPLPGDVPEAGRRRGSARPAGRRPGCFGGRPVEMAVYRRGGLAPGSRLAGPAVVEEEASTAVIPPGATATVDRWGNVLIDVC
jgi:N-methylhydantoinase A/oxoprolinase/acetone carboxylase beta subunit